MESAPFLLVGQIRAGRGALGYAGIRAPSGRGDRKTCDRKIPAERGKRAQGEEIRTVARLISLSASWGGVDPQRLRKYKAFTNGLSRDGRSCEAEPAGTEGPVRLSQQGQKVL